MKIFWIVIGLLTLLVLALAVTTTLVLVLLGLLRIVRDRHRDRYRRRFRKGTWVPLCDAVAYDDTPYGPAASPCRVLAHWMVIRPDIPWGTGEKTCWRHYRRSAYLGHCQGVAMPINRDTAWVSDPPPRRGIDV